MNLTLEPHPDIVIRRQHHDTLEYYSMNYHDIRITKTLMYSQFVVLSIMWYMR